MKEQFMKEVGERIQSLRKHLHLSQEELAEKADTSKQTVSIIESGKREMLASNAVKIADALGVSTDYLLKGTRTDADSIALDDRVRTLTADQFNFVDDIVSRFIDFCEKGK